MLASILFAAVFLSGPSAPARAAAPVAVSSVSVAQQESAELGVSMSRTLRDVLQRNSGLWKLLGGLALALLCTLALMAAIRCLAKAYDSALPGIEDFLRHHMPRAKFQGVDLLPGDQFVDGAVAAAGGTRYLLLALMFYIYLPLVFSFFPWTHGLAGTLFGYIIDPVNRLLSATLSFIPDFFVIIIMVSLTYNLQKIIRTVFRELGRGRIVISGFYPDWAEPTCQIVRVLIWAFTLVAIFPYLPGSSSPAFKGMSVFIGVLLSFGSSSAISNGVAGIILTYMRPFQLGDRVKIAETVGDVVDRSILVTRVRTIKNVEVTIPNAMVLSSHIVNYSTSAQEPGLILHTAVTIGYDAPWKKVHEVLIAAARQTPDILPEPAPFVLQTALGDFNVAYEINAYTDKPGVMAATYSALHANIQDRFNAAGLEIMSPNYLALRDGNPAAVPQDKLPKGYRAPAFRVDIPGHETRTP